MKRPPRIVQEELELLEIVLSSLGQPEGRTASEEEIVADLERLRDEIPGAKTEDRGALLDQYDRQIAILQQLRTARAAPVVDPANPYFAHLRLRESDEAEPWDLCLGKATYLEDDVRIVDWRNAPISRVFYGYREGEEYREEFADRVQTGRVVARRLVAIRDGRLVRVESSAGVLRLEDAEWVAENVEPRRLVGGEGTAFRVHETDAGVERRLGADLEGSRRRLDKRLPDIAGLLDPDQFDLITRPTSGVLAIRGAAGSGKTTVALHRIAWMAHEDPEVDSDATLVLVFSRALRDYVGHVLPALGVRRVQILTYEEWARRQCVRHFPNLPKVVRESTPPLVLKLKLHPILHDALEAHVARTPGPSTRDQAIDDWMSVLSDADLIARTARERAPGSFTEAELADAVRSNRDQVEAVAAWLDRDRDVQAELDAEDASILLSAWQLRVGPLRGRGKKALRYRHVAIDEVQDFSALELRVVLGCLDEHQSLTLAGDTRQHVVAYSGFTSWDEIFGRLGLEGSAIDTLLTSYRSTHEILCFATSVLGDLAGEEPPTQSTRSGPPVECFRFSHHGACVAFLAEALEELLREEPLASVALLTPDPEISAAYHDGLAKARVPELRLVSDQRFTFRPGVDVAEVEAAKGLEFDYVVLIEATAEHYPDRPEARRLLHVGATRAVHQLWLTAVGTPSPRLAGILG